VAAYVNNPGEGERLMLAVQRDEEGGLEALIRRYERPVFRALVRMTRRDAVAEELAQEVFLRVFRARKTYQPVARFETWLFRIVWNLASNHSRTAKDRPISIEDVGPSRRGSDDREGGEGAAWVPGNEEDPSAALEAEERRTKVREAIEELPESQRLAVILHRYQALSYEEIGESMNLSVPAVKSMLHRARLTLQAKLAPYAGAEVRP
jgi:RNA polymerase sigma-70 factor (ECF subfamily)